jgi:hypothetical protein
MAKCKYCGKEIVWMQEGRKKVPVEVDGAAHECDEYNKSKNSLKVVDPGTIDPEILKQYQDRINQKKK